MSEEAQKETPINHAKRGKIFAQYFIFASTLWEIIQQEFPTQWFTITDLIKAEEGFLYSYYDDKGKMTRYYKENLRQTEGIFEDKIHWLMNGLVLVGLLQTNSIDPVEVQFKIREGV